MGLDSVELVMEVEEAFGISLPDEVVSRAETAGQLHAAVLEALRAPVQIMDERPCWKCGYNLRGLRDPRCPECGAPFLLYGKVDPDIVWEILVELICEQLAVKREHIKPDTHFVKDLRMDC